MGLVKERSKEFLENIEKEIEKEVKSAKKEILDLDLKLIKLLIEINDRDPLIAKLDPSLIPSKIEFDIPALIFDINKVTDSHFFKKGINKKGKYVEYDDYVNIEEIPYYFLKYIYKLYLEGNIAFSQKFKEIVNFNVEKYGMKIWYENMV